MFTGLIQEVGRISKVVTQDRGRYLEIEHQFFSRPVEPGESIAINGACMTVVMMKGKTIGVQLSEESLKRTNLSDLAEGMSVNLERAVTAGASLGGHFVQGHIDGLAIYAGSEACGECHKVRIKIPRELESYVVEKGSICIDGVSLTINRILEENILELMIVPHTWENTIFKLYKNGQAVNIEVDVLAKYVEKLVDSKIAASLEKVIS